ncbi:MAG: hypothetical protein JSS81_28635 [Acidobacteria bacterium]|nr:hypothetical protein [Acidobacteriota bacterium]
MKKILTFDEKMRIADLAATKLFAPDARPVIFEMDSTAAVALIGQLQLAFRHPENTGRTREITENFVRNLIEQMDPDHGDVYEFLMMGFNPEMDAVSVLCKNCRQFVTIADGHCPNCMESICPRCGCTDSAACSEGCFWLPDGICSSCGSVDLVEQAG